MRFAGNMHTCKTNYDTHLIILIQLHPVRRLSMIPSVTGVAELDLHRVKWFALLLISLILISNVVALTMGLIFINLVFRNGM